jgi:hypothetical protein
MRDQWWLAELDRYGNARLADGPHGDRSGAEKAMTLFNQLGFADGRRFAIAEVRLSEPTGLHSPVNSEAVGTLNSIGLRPQAAALRDKGGGHVD